MKIPGLCPGGGCDPRLDTPGFVIFWDQKSGDSGKTVEDRNFEWYLENILL